MGSEHCMFTFAGQYYKAISKGYWVSRVLLKLKYTPSVILCANNWFITRATDRSTSVRWLFRVSQSQLYETNNSRELVEIEGVMFLLPHSLERVEVELLFNGVGNQLRGRLLQVLVASVEPWKTVKQILLLEKWSSSFIELLNITTWTQFHKQSWA